MKRHAAAPVVAVLAAGPLATACSGDGGSSDDIPGAGGTETQPEDGDNESDLEPGDEEPEAGDDGIDRPEIVLPDDVINVFEEDTDDPAELAVLADQEHHINAVDEAITSGSIDGRALAFYTAGEAIIDSIEYISGMHDDKLTFAGTTRYCNREVTIREDGMATTLYCTNGSDSYTVNTDTGEKDPDTGTKYLHSSRLELNDEGVWQTVSYTVTSEAERMRVRSRGMIAGTLAAVMVLGASSAAAAGGNRGDCKEKISGDSDGGPGPSLGRAPTAAATPCRTVSSPPSRS